MMTEGIPAEISLETSERSGETMHGLLIPLVHKAHQIQFFETLSEGLNLKMKVVTYTHQNKIETIVAGVAVGCRRMVQMQAKLTPDTTAAGLFGMKRFPDQSQINNFLRACTASQVEHLEQAHQRLLERNSLAADRDRWLRLADGRGVLPVDCDQSPIPTRSTRATGVAKGYFGRKRGNVGYKKSVALLGGDVKEVLWLRLEPGNTHAQEAVPTILARLKALAEAKGIDPGEMLLRGDSQYGSVGTVRQAQQAGMHYLFNGYTPQTARQLAENLPQDTVWHSGGVDSNGAQVWLADAGQQQLAGHEGEPITTRVVLQVRVAWRMRKKHGRGAPGQVPEKAVSYEHYLTDLPAQALPLIADELGKTVNGAPGKTPTVMAVYNGRESQERFFQSEQDALGSQYLRTYKMEGEAVFLWLMASAVNLLRWTQSSTFVGTELERVGLGKMVSQAMQIPASILQEAHRLIITLPEALGTSRRVAAEWVVRESQLRLPFDFAFNTS